MGLEVRAGRMERERNPMDMVRGAYMDGDRSAPQGRDYPKDQEVQPEIGRRDGAGGQGWEDRRSREDASGRREEPDGRREGSRSGKDESRSGREESRPGRSRDEGRGRQGSRREEKREEKGSSSRRRSRSREKERARSKERESSPYSKALESWRKFKQAEKVALDQVATRREIFDKRPEDHPAYGEEWRIFWEKRYKELQAQGRDAANHDFKSEWIPYWTKRVAELFDKEVLEKTDDLK